MRGIGKFVLERDYPDDFGNIYAPCDAKGWVHKWTDWLWSRNYYFTGE